jgi:hypothetical protein
VENPVLLGATPDGIVSQMIIYRQQRFAFFTLLEHTELTLSLTEKAHPKTLAKTRRLMNEDGLA